MTDPVPEPYPSLSADDGVRAPLARRRVASAVHEVCPLLRSERGAWRSAYAAREHRCRAVQPAVQVAIGKQRSLCLVPAHVDCATYLAATAPSTGLTSPSPGDQAAELWPDTRSTPLLLEPTRGLLTPMSSGSTRAGGGALLIGLMVLAFIVLVVARTTSPATGAPTPGASASAVLAVPSAATPAAPSPGETPSPSASASPTPSATAGGPSASPAATPTDVPAKARRYTVRSGDTLSGIAARFKTTVKAIATANNISDARLIRPGQVLIIP